MEVTGAETVCWDCKKGYEGLIAMRYSRRVHVLRKAECPLTLD